MASPLDFRALVLSESESREVADRVQNLRTWWIPRQGIEGFFTLGPSPYDLCDKERGKLYLDRVAPYRSLLMEHFGDLYDRVTSALSDHLNAPVSLAEHLGLPNFHVWIGSSIPTEVSQAHMHFDTHFHGPPFLHEWKLSADECVATPQISFTLPVRLPADGGGLYIWDLSYEEYLSARADGLIDSPRDGARFRKRIEVPYAVGYMVMHDGLHLHQIKSVRTIHADDIRITLQGHAIWRSGPYEVFW